MLKKRSLLSPFFFQLTKTLNSKLKKRSTQCKKVLSVTLLLNDPGTLHFQGISAMSKDKVGESLLGEKRKKRYKWEEPRQITALRLHFYHHAQFVLLSKAPPQPGKKQPSCPSVPVESNTTASLEMQSFLHNLPDPLLKAGHFLTLRDPVNSKVHWRSCSSHLPARAELLDQCVLIFTSLLSEHGSSAREKDVSYCKEAGMVQCSQTKFLLSSSLLLPHRPRMEICILQSVLVLKVYADVAAFQGSLKSAGNTIWGNRILVSASNSENRGSISALIPIPFSFNVDLPS